MSMPGITNEESTRLNSLWAVADRAGLHRCSAMLESALKEYDEALAAKRAVEADAAEARADHDSQVALTEMAASRCITREGNKTFVPDDDGTARQVTADEARTWIARIVDQDAAASETKAALTKVTLRLEEAKDRIAVAERRIQTTKYATDSAVALTSLLSHAFKDTK